MVDNGAFTDEALTALPSGILASNPALGISRNQHTGASHLLCVAHHQVIAWQGVKARLNKQECGTVCREATGADCTCSCGGTNHGMYA